MSDHAVATREEATPDLICDHAYRAVCRCGWEDDQVRGWGSARKKAQEHVDLHALAVWGDELRAAERAVWVARAADWQESLVLAETKGDAIEVAASIGNFVASGSGENE